MTFYLRDALVTEMNRFDPRTLRDENPAFIVSLRHGFAYAMIGKTGNESVKTALAKSLGIRPRVSGYGYPWVPRPIANSTAKLVRRVLGKAPPAFDVHARNYGWRLMTLPQAANSKLFRFAFVRNPWDRLVSVWGNKVAALRGVKATTDRFPPEVQTDWEFERFARWAIRQEVPEGHFRPQSQHIVYRGRLVADFVGRFETLSHDWEQVRGRFGLEPLPKRNASRHAPYRDLYTPELRNSVGDYYAEDIRRFGYDF